METIVFQIELEDGRIFRVFCANSTQKKKLINEHYHKFKNNLKEVKVITSGVHTLKEFEKHLPTL